MTRPASQTAPDAHRAYVRAIDAHFAGATSPAREHDMRAHLVGCASCRTYYDRHLLLAAVDTRSSRPAAERLARGLGLSPPPSSENDEVARAPWWRGPRLAVASALLSAVACVVLFFAVKVEPPAPRGASARSHLLAYELDANGVATSLTSHVTRGHALAFAYANAGHKARLLVFAVDEHRQILWFHPAWTDARDNPKAIALAQDDLVHELPQATSHRFAGKRLHLRGVFLDEATAVRDVEARLGHDPLVALRDLRAAFPRAEVTELDLEILSP